MYWQQKHTKPVRKDVTNAKFVTNDKNDTNVKNDNIVRIVRVVRVVRIVLLVIIAPTTTIFQGGRAFFRKLYLAVPFFFVSLHDEAKRTARLSDINLSK